MLEIGRVTDSDESGWVYRWGCPHLPISSQSRHLMWLYLGSWGSCDRQKNPRWWWNYTWLMVGWWNKTKQPIWSIFSGTYFFQIVQSPGWTKNWTMNWYNSSARSLNVGYFSNRVAYIQHSNLCPIIITSFDVCICLYHSNPKKKKSTILLVRMIWLWLAVHVFGYPLVI